MREESIKAAVERFEQLLRDQVRRAEALGMPKPQRGEGPVVIGIADGDGIGPVLLREARRILDVLLENEIRAGRVILKEIPDLTLEKRMELGTAIPPQTLSAIRECDVLLKGPTTTPSGGTLESANVALRRELDLYANTRPVRVPEEGIDWMFFRENTEGEYALGSKGLALEDLMTMDFKVTTDAGCRRIARAAFEYARNNGKGRVTVVTKSNIMKKTDGMFSRIAKEIAAEYPEITCDEYYIDIMTANLVDPAVRSGFQVMLLPNLYGDIITDEAAQIQGGVGTAGSANLGDRYAMFEAIHGSAPRMVEAGLAEYANPSSILTAAVMMLRHIRLTDAAKRLERAVEQAAAALNMTGTREGDTCRDFGDRVIEAL